ncbi:MAG TPA: hypothetical protein VJV75_04550 [Candidatus Polarisedimenticolia bacterium]|nr:hypothetical protein [Candidatus Polarisedimenticolia bacterium]
MPLVKASLFADVWEHICERCRETLRPKILDLLLAAIRRIARRERRLSEQEPMPQPVRATAPLPQFTNRLRLRDPRGCEAQGGTPHVRT